MPNVIAVFLNGILCDDCKKRIGTNYRGTEIRYFSFRSFKELHEKYEGAKGDCSAVVTDTFSTRKFLKPYCERDNLPLCSFFISLESIYRTLIVEAGIKSCADLTKTGLDFIDAKADLKDILLNSDLQEYADKKAATVKSWPEDDMEGLESYVPELYKKRYAEGNLQFILTRSEEVMEFAKEKGIEAHYVYPTLKELYSALDAALGGIEETAHRNNLPAVISFDLNLSGENADRKEIEFRKVMFDFEKEASVHLPVKSSHAVLEVYTDAATVRTLTCDYKGCWLSGYLKARLDFAVRIGYGVGENISQARLHSSDALSACCAYERVRLIDESGSEYFLSPCVESDCPSLCEEEMKKASVLSEKAGLSSDIIVQFMLCIKELEKNEISSSDIMNCAGFSLRSANKYLSRLESSGLAEVCGQRSYGNKGRPTKIYRILFDKE